VRTIHEDFRTAELADGAYDVVLAAAVLHHLRDDADWLAAFAKLHRIVAPGGSVWITDLVWHETPPSTT
jgi:tRNA (cmo5U34)-methyltransferase